MKGRFHQMIPIQIDRCKPCDSLWLDTGEYALIRRLYVELWTSTDPRIVELREKVASVQAAWDQRVHAVDGAHDAMAAAANFEQFTLAELTRMLR